MESSLRTERNVAEWNGMERSCACVILILMELIYDTVVPFLVGIHTVKTCGGSKSAMWLQHAFTSFVGSGAERASVCAA